MSKSYDPKAPCWGVLCPVEVGRLVAWLEANPPAWPPVVRDEPNSVPAPAAALGVMQTVCEFLGTGVRWDRPNLSRLVPGVAYGYHSDGQPSNWVTRVHVPLVTSDACWFAWEEQGGAKVYMAKGWAYSFNTIKAHAYANEGKADRVHLMFDALQG